jgi:hypothetical protein
MKKIYSSHDGAMIDYLQKTLTHEGIACVLKNQYLAGGAGELPPTECWPEIWITDNRQAAAAHRIIEDLLTHWPQHAEQQSAWYCPACGADNEAQFTACWQCEQERAV